MVKPSYVPEQGDLVWISFGLGYGHEQAGRRPAFVISPRIYNVQSGLALICPITSQAKNYPFEVVIETAAVRGVVMVDQLRSIDWQARKIRYAGRIYPEALHEVQGKLRKLIE